MVSSLLNRTVSKRPDRIRFNGRILFLTEDPHLIQRQLNGEDLAWRPDIPLRHDISTDEIAPAYICYYFDETLGEFAYIGLRTGGQSPVTRGSVKRGGFVASVSGKRRGKGSSREQAPYAELSAGIRLVIAENIERIYRQNCQNLGMLTSTNFQLIERLERGDEIALSEFTEGEDEITCQIIEYGGLFAFNVARLQGQARLPQIRTPQRPMTLAEKILARHMVVNLTEDRVGVAAVQPGDAGFVRADIRFSHEYVTPMAAMMFKQLVGEHEKVNDPSSIYLFRDHLTFLDEVMPPERRAMGLLDLAIQQKLMQEAFAREQGITYHGELTDRKGSEGICHNIILENYALPGQVIVGTDSHTPHAGAIGCVAFGVGTTDIFNSWITKDVRVCVPPSVKVIVRGRLPAGVTAKDLILAILRLEYVKSGQAIGKVIEYAGDAIEALSIDERATMTNMAAEIGGFTGVVAPDEKTVDFLVERRGLPRAEAQRLCEGLFSDPDAAYDHVIELDASQLRPMVALPGDPSQGVFIDELTEVIPIEIAYGGSCTAGKKADMDMYARVLREALQQGRGVHPSVKFYIQFGSQEVRRYCVEQGYLEIFHRAGATVIEPSCGACINAGPGGTSRADQISISAQNRNFPGRSGPGQLYLANPLTVAASAVAGRIMAYEEPPEVTPAHP
ncbi:MAG: aconitase family protein [Acidobacteriota bacterium]|nr:aconitase family protein [Blastocatellia bacterium]MDW8239187.1 aconitase family protein [Acidobacteriota bacterium]